MTRSTLPVGGYSVNPYVGCPHACRYCYASFMKRFTGHTEPWGSFLDIKSWEPIKNPHLYDGKRVVIGSVTDGYNPYEKYFRRTRKVLEELQGSSAEIMICTKSDLVLRDIELLKKFPKPPFHGLSIPLTRISAPTWTKPQLSHPASKPCDKCMKAESEPFASYPPFSRVSQM